LSTLPTHYPSFFLTDTLDVACGNTPRGTVNVDLFKGASFHRGSSAPIDTKNTRHFIQCDCHYLPFSDNTFNTVQCWQLIEHEDVRPMALIRELIRVSKWKVIIVCPHRFASFPFKKGCEAHVRVFNIRSMIEHLHKAGIQDHQIITETRDFSCFPHHFFPLFRFPQHMVTTIYL
jgi:SAM-dependent methyltransferase